MAAPTITRTPLVDDDGTLTTGTVWNNAWQTALYNAIDALLAAEDGATKVVTQGGTGIATLAAHGVVVGEGTAAVAVAGPNATIGAVLTGHGAAADPSFDLPVVQTTTLVGAQNDFALTAATRVLRCNNATLLTLSGFAAGYDGQIVRLESVGAGQVDLLHQSALSLAVNRNINFATVGITSLAPGVGTAKIMYDGTAARWRLVAHEQGAWITRTFSAGNYAGIAGTWTVTAGQVSADAFYLRGRTLSFAESVVGSSTTTPGVNLHVTIPNGLIAAKQMYTGGGITDAGVRQAALVEVTAGSSAVNVYRVDVANLTAGAGNVTVLVSHTFEVQ